MNNILELITREDVYNIGVPIGIAILNGLLPHVLNALRDEKQWKYAKEKSSSDKIWNYTMKMLGTGVMIYVLYFAVIFFVEILFCINISNVWIERCYLIWSVLWWGFALLGTQSTKGKLFYKRDYKCEEKLTEIIYKLPIIFSGLMWTSVMFDTATIISRIDAVLIILFDIVITVILENETRIDCESAKFHFYSGKTLENIEVGSIYKSGKWVVVKNKDSNTEYRFRLKDMEIVEYK